MLARFAETETKTISRIVLLTGFIYALGALAGGFLGAFIIEALMPYPTISIPALVVGVIFLIGFVAALYYRSQLRAQRETIKITVEGILLKYPELAAIIQERSGLVDEEEPIGDN